MLLQALRTEQFSSDGRIGRTYKFDMQNSSGRTPKRNLGTITLYAFFKHKFHSSDETSTSMKHSPNRFEELCPIAFAKMTSNGTSTANAVWVFDLSTLAADKSDDKSSGSFVTKGDAPLT